MESGNRARCEIGADQLRAADFDTLRAEIERGGGGDGGYLYRLKTPTVMHHGPFGEYVREHFLRPQELSSHDYLRTPELIEDVAHAAHDLYGADLLGAYTAATKPCIVAFDMPHDDDTDAIEATCWYLRAAARGEATRNACGGFDGPGPRWHQQRSATSRSSTTSRAARRQSGSNGLP